MGRPCARWRDPNTDRPCLRQQMFALNERTGTGNPCRPQQQKSQKRVVITPARQNHVAFRLPGFNAEIACPLRQRRAAQAPRHWRQTVDLPVTVHRQRCDAKQQHAAKPRAPCKPVSTAVAHTYFEPQPHIVLKYQNVPRHDKPYPSREQDPRTRNRLRLAATSAGRTSSGSRARSTGRR